MIDDHDVREMLRRRADTVSGAPVDTPKAVRRARRRLGLNGAVATVAAAAIAVATVAGIDAIRSAPIPADDPSEELGIFATVSARIVYVNEAHGYGGPGLWAVDPSGPSDTPEGTSVAEDVASTLVRLGPEDAIPIGWSRDGTELLFKRTSDGLFPREYLYILHADGSETRVTTKPMRFGGATISPDGSRIVFAAWADELGLYAVDAEGGPREVLLPGKDGLLYAPTYSPDGTQIAYVQGGGDHDHHVWVMDADGADAHEILAVPTTKKGVVSGLEWSPAGDRIAIGVQERSAAAIYTFAPDGSDFTQVITDANEPHWSPDGSQIAYTIECVLSDTSCGGLAIADADGSNVREFGFAASGPWHPGTGRAREGEVVPDPMPGDATKVRGWPDTTRNPPGVYSWDRSRCASHSCVMGFMHNGHGSGEVRIRIQPLPEGYTTDGATAATVAGHDGLHRRIDAQREEWIVDIEGTTIAIRLNVRPAASQADLDAAHAIIGSMRTEPRDNDLGFRLVFTLTTNDWDSG